MKLPNLNYKKGVIRLVVGLTLVFAVFGWQDNTKKSFDSWSWYLDTIKDEDITKLAMQEAKKDKCSKASIIEVTFEKDKEKEVDSLVSQETLLIVLNKDKNKPNVLGDDASKECPNIAQLSRYMKLPKTAFDDGLLVTNVTEEMFKSAESLQKRRVYWAYILERLTGSYEYVLMLWKVLATIAIAFYLIAWTIKGFKAKG